ncbi:hypothetical protein L915_21526 [Phytophthora nicotianae]|nr:hypothetical protein L915_21526 [Phytophthora nicotianae]ETL24621.1 hypothetical protein L916_21391 [Phytophthora nicotianae]
MQRGVASRRDETVLHRSSCHNASTRDQRAAPSSSFGRRSLLITHRELMAEPGQVARCNTSCWQRGLQRLAPQKIALLVIRAGIAAVGSSNNMYSYQKNDRLATKCANCNAVWSALG